MTEIDLYDSPQAGKDYVLEVRIRNGPLLRALRARGFQSAMAFAEATKFNYSTLCSYLGLRRAPISKTGHWHDSALVLAKLLHLPPDSLFPEQHLEQALSRSRGEVEVSREELCLMLAGPTDDSDAEHELERQQVHGRLQDLMYGCLRPREMRVLAGRFGFDADGAKTLDELADEMGVGRERIRQIEAVALRRLGARANRRKLESAGGYGFVVARAATSKLSDQKFVVGTKKALVAALQQNHIRKKNISSLFGEHAGELTLAVRRHGNGSTVCLIQAERIRVCVAIAQSVGIQVLGYKDPSTSRCRPMRQRNGCAPTGTRSCRRHRSKCRYRLLLVSMRVRSCPTPPAPIAARNSIVSVTAASRDQAM